MIKVETLFRNYERRFQRRMLEETKLERELSATKNKRKLELEENNISQIIEIKKELAKNFDYSRESNEIAKPCPDKRMINRFQNIALSHCISFQVISKNVLF